MSWKIRQRVGGLYWRLTNAYFLVTLVAALLIEVAVTVPSTVGDLRQSAERVQFARLLEQRDAPQLAPYLQPHVPDTQTLQDALIRVVFAETAANGWPVLAIGIVGSNQQVLATIPSCTHGPANPPSQATACDDPEARQIADNVTAAPVRAALNDDLGPAHWIGTLQATTLVGVPIPRTGGGSLGALVIVLRGAVIAPNAPASATFTRFVGALWNTLAETGLYFILLASAIGTVTGLLVTRNVTRRLRQITHAAGSWSRGDFAVTVRDRTRDEIGVLAQDLNSMASQIQALLTMRQALAVVEERNRLSRDLHDVVKQHIFANALLVNAARTQLASSPEQAGRHLAEAERLAQLAQEELATLIHALRPAALEDKGLVTILRAYLDDWALRTGIAVQFHVAGARATPLALEEVLLRVAQEALANVARHSGAAHTDVTLAWEEDELALTIADDGHGFDTQQASAGMGLQSMRERAEVVQGRVAVRSSSTGTTIHATIPLAGSRIHSGEELKR